MAQNEVGEWNAFLPLHADGGRGTDGGAQGPTAIGNSCRVDSDMTAWGRKALTSDLLTPDGSNTEDRTFRCCRQKKNNNSGEHSSQTRLILSGGNLNHLGGGRVIHSYHQIPGTHTAAQTWPGAGSLLVPILLMPPPKPNNVQTAGKAG